MHEMNLYASRRVCSPRNLPSIFATNPLGQERDAGEWESSQASLGRKDCDHNSLIIRKWSCHDTRETPLAISELTL